VAFKYRLNQKDSNGEAITVLESFTNVLTQKSNLHKRLVSLTGAQPGAEFDSDSLIGWKGQLCIEHVTGDDGQEYANVTLIIRGKKSEVNGRP
jgi:hypothetical protein